MRILVIGGAGYIGSHVVKELVDQGHGVVVLDDLSTGHRQALKGSTDYADYADYPSTISRSYLCTIFRTYRAGGAGADYAEKKNKGSTDYADYADYAEIKDKGGEFIKGDLGDRELLGQIFSSRKIDCVMHFAALSLVGESVKYPLSYYDNNTAKTTRLLMAMKDHGVNKFILSSTAAVYGEPENIPILETDPTEPTNPYGRSKLFIEKILEDCDAAHGLKYTSLRYFNAAGADEDGQIGEDHKPETHLIPLVLEVALGQRESIKIFGIDWDTPDGTCIRDYIHVTDLAEAHILASQRLMDGGESAIYNLGCQSGYSVKEIIDIARKVTGHSIPAEEAARRPGDPARLVASSDKIKEGLGWSPRFDDPEKIITTAWRWHRNHPSGFSHV